MPRLVVALALAVVAASCGGGGGAAGGGGGSDGRDGDGGPSAGTTRGSVATGLEVPWGIAFLPGGDALVSERTTARILRIPAGGGEPEVAMEVPGVDTAAGEGGLLGIAVSPTYERDRLVYAYYTTGEDNRIARFRLGGQPQPLLTGLERSIIHNGGRIAFGPEGKLYAGVGDAGRSELAQDPSSENGKILRMEPDGSVPADNPDPRSRVWTLGHRNVQGLAWDEDGRLWATEFGQNEVDEVNLIRPGRNYGWPEVEGDGDTDGGRLTNPLVTWPTGDASPSGAAVAGGALYVAALRGETLWRIPLNGDATGEPERLLDGRDGRLRTVVLAPDGSLWVATSNRDGRGSPREGDDRIVRVAVG
jgi:glucose/arabinose dehydrogenase